MHYAVEWQIKIQTLRNTLKFKQFAKDYKSYLVGIDKSIGAYGTK